MNKIMTIGIVVVGLTLMGITAACESRGTADNPTHVVCDNR